MNGTAALVRWTHEASEHSEYVYRLEFKGGPTVEVRDANVTYTLIGSLEADREYNVTVTAFQQVGKKEYNSTSDEKLLTMLPKGISTANVARMSRSRMSVVILASTKNNLKIFHRSQMHSYRV